MVAAFGFLFATPLMTHLAHYQLTLTAFLVPLSLLLLLRYLETWRLRYGIGLGLAFAALTTSATYFGLMMACALPVVFVGYVLWYRPKPVWPFLRGLVAGGAVAIVITLPVAVQYLQLQDDSYFRRGFDPSVAAHLGDLLSPMDENIVLTELWPFEEFSFDRSGENRLFPGFVVTGFGIAGVVVLVRGLRRGRAADEDTTAAEPVATGPPPVDTRWRRRMGLLVMGGGLVTLLLSFGDEVTIAGADVPLPFKVLREVAPGFSGIRATSRFVVMTTCALAVCAAFAMAALLHHRRRLVAVGALVVLCTLVFVETAVTIPLVRVPDGRVADGVVDHLDDRPPGVVAELPIRGPADGAAWAYLESPAPARVARRHRRAGERLQRLRPRGLRRNRAGAERVPQPGGAGRARRARRPLRGAAHAGAGRAAPRVRRPPGSGRVRAVHARDRTGTDRRDPRPRRAGGDPRFPAPSSSSCGLLPRA